MASIQLPFSVGSLKADIVNQKSLKEENDMKTNAQAREQVVFSLAKQKIIQAWGTMALVLKQSTGLSNVTRNSQLFSPLKSLMNNQIPLSLNSCRSCTLSNVLQLS